MARRRYYKRENTTGKVVAAVLSTVLIGGLVAGAIYHKDDIKDFFSDTPTTETGGFETSVEQFEYRNAPSLSGDLDVTEETPKLVFSGRMENAIVNEVFDDSNTGYGLIVSPLADFDAVNTKKVRAVDWKTAFDKSKIDPLIDIELDDNSDYVNIGAEYTEFEFGLPIEYGMHNTRYAAVMYKYEKADNGDIRYLYTASSPQVSNTSAVYRATEKLALNQGADRDLGKVDYTDAEIVAFNKIVNDAVDYAEGLSKPTDNNSTYKYTTNIPNIAEMEAWVLPVTQDSEEWFNIKVEVEYGLDVYVNFRNTDDDLGRIMVYPTGVVDQGVEQSAIIQIYVGGEYEEVQCLIRAAESDAA